MGGRDWNPGSLAEQPGAQPLRDPASQKSIVLSERREPRAVGKGLSLLKDEKHVLCDLCFATAQAELQEGVQGPGEADPPACLLALSGQ